VSGLRGLRLREVPRLDHKRNTKREIENYGQNEQMNESKNFKQLEAKILTRQVNRLRKGKYIGYTKKITYIHAFD